VSDYLSTCSGEDISSPGPEDYGSSDNSEGSSEPPFMLPDILTLTRSQEMKVLEKIRAFKSALPVYVAAMIDCNVRRRRSGMSLVSLKTS
jgi:hypothetical protein